MTDNNQSSKDTSRDIFSGDLASTSQGFLSCSALLGSVTSPVLIRDNDGLTLADAGFTRSVNMSVTAANTLTVTGILSPDQLSTNTIRTRGSSNLTLQPLGGGVLISAGKHLSLGGATSSKYTLDVLTSAINGAESLCRFAVSDAVQTDYLEIINSASASSSFVPTIQSVQSSSSVLSILKIAAVTTRVSDTTNDACAVEFSARNVDSTPLQHKNLFQWRNGGGSRAATCMMEMVPSNGKADLCLPNALNPRVSLSGSTGNVGCSSIVSDACVTREVTLSNSNVVITSDADLDLLSIHKDDRKLLGLDSVGMQVAGRVSVIDEDCNGASDFDLLRVGGCSPIGAPPIPPALLVKRSGAVSHGQLDISGDPSLSLLTVHPRNASAAFSIGSEGCDFHLHESSNFVMENIQTQPLSGAPTPGRLVWDSLRDLALVDTGAGVRKLGPTTIDQIDITLTDSSDVVGGSSGAPPSLTSFDRSLMIPPNTLTPGTRYSLCVDGSMSRFSPDTVRIVMTVGGVIVYDDTCSQFSTTGGPISDAAWSIEVDLTCRTGGSSGTCVAYGECMVPFERGDIPTQENRVSKYDVKACKRSVVLDCTVENACIVSIQWGEATIVNDRASIATYDLAVAKK